MDYEIKKLYAKYKTIQEKGWIKSLKNGSTGIGYTFETLIGKKADNSPLPDFGKFEIKCMRKFSKQKIHLFCLTPDGGTPNPIKEILNNLGYPSKSDSNFLVFNTCFNAFEYTYIGLYKKVTLYVNRRDKRVEFIAFKNSKKIHLNIFWTFEKLEKRLSDKLSYLCIVKAETKKIEDDEYFLYNYIAFYKFKGFEKFINLLESGKISVGLQIGYYKSKNRYGEIHDRGTSFSIQCDDIELLYDRI